MSRSRFDINRDDDVGSGWIEMNDLNSKGKIKSNPEPQGNNNMQEMTEMKEMTDIKSDDK